jgi:hypothetical protein
MGEAHFAGTRIGRAADEARVGNGVVRRAERPPRDHRLLGREQPATLWTFVVSSASSSVSGGQMPGMRLASIDLPLPGGPIISTLWPPATATSMARFTCSCPFTSAKSCSMASNSCRGFRWDRCARAGCRACRRGTRPPRADGDRIDVEARDDGRFGRVGGGKDEALLAMLAGGKRDGQRALDGPHFN